MLFSKYFSIQLKISLIAIMSMQGCSMSEDSTHLLLREARNLESLGDFKKAEGTFKKIPVLDDKKSSPLQLAILMNMARFYLRINDYSKVIIICDKASRACDEVYGPNDELKASILFIQACAYEGLKDYDKAKSIYKSLLLFAQQHQRAKEMRSLLPLIKLGDIEFRKNNFQQALKLYYKASVITLLPNPLYRILNYRLAVCSIALGRISGAEFYFGNSLPLEYRAAGPPELFDQFAQLLKRNYKYGGAGRLFNQKADWESQRKEYLDWLYPRVKVPLRFNLLDKCTEKDFLNYMENANKSRVFDNLMHDPSKVDIN